MKKNDVFTVTIEDMGEDGAGIGKTDGYIWFIKDALIGDVIQASVMLCQAGEDPGACAGTGRAPVSGGQGLRRLSAPGAGL